MIYTDFIHIVTDGNLDQLHDFCHKIGIKRHWFHYHPQHPHYDFPKTFDRQIAIDAGAIEKTSTELVEICHKNPNIQSQSQMFFPNDENKKTEKKNQEPEAKDFFGEYYD